MAKVNIAECWAQVERWLSANAPDAVSMLPAGASTNAFTQAEKTLGYPLPREVQEFLAIHDGSGTLWLHDHGEFMSLEGTLAAWDQEFDLWGDGNNDEWANPQGPIKKKWFARKWLPVLDARTGDHVCIDLDPPKGGKRGQIITWYHDNGPTEVIAASFGALLAGFVAELEGGLYTPRLNQAGQPYLEYIGGRAEPGAAPDTAIRFGTRCSSDDGGAGELVVRHPEDFRMRVVDIDGSRLIDEAAFWREYLAAVRPDGAEYFGRNLGAFRDAVTAGGPGWPGEHCRIRVVGHAAAGVGAAFFAKFAEIAGEASGFELELA